MTKFNTTLGLNKDNFSIKIKSSRISKRRNIIHSKINIIKNKFKKKRVELFNIYHNKDDNDVITQYPVKDIPIKDILSININNKLYCTSASNLIKWMVTYDVLDLPQHPLTREFIKKDIRTECYNIANNFSKLNNNNDLELVNSLCIFYNQEFYRKFPFQLEILYYKCISSLKSLANNIINNNNTYNYYISIDNLKTPNMFPHLSEINKQDIMNIGYEWERYDDRLIDLYFKINSNYFI